MSQVERQFDPSDEKYMCCCCHVMTGSKTLAVLGTASNILSVAALIVIIAKSGSEYRYVESWQIFLFGCFVFLAIALNICLWRGLIKEREGYLIPTLVVMIVGLALEGFVGIIIIWEFAKDAIKSHQYITRHAFYAVAYLILIILIGLQCWFLFIINSAYRYIKDKRAAAGGTADVPQMERVYTSVSKDDPAPPTHNNGSNVI